MGAPCRPEALIAARQVRQRVAATSILSHVAARLTWATLLMKASAEETGNLESDWRPAIAGRPITPGTRT